MLDRADSLVVAEPLRGGRGRAIFLVWDGVVMAPAHGHT